MNDRFRQPPRQRENDDPDEATRPLPRPFLVVVACMVAWGAWYIVQFDGSSDPTYGDSRTLAALADAPAGAVSGAQLFTSKCAGCHQASGQGVAGVFPSLVGVPWVVGSERRLVQILLHGIQGAIEVNGTVYNGVMPAWSSLPDEEIAALATYVRGTWGNAASAVTAETVAAERARTAARTAPWQGGAELETIE